jgi:hypothetical protein
MPDEVLNVIVGALLAGAGKVLKDAAAKTYQRLIDGLRSRFGEEKADELQDLARDTGDREAVRAYLIDALDGQNIAADDEVVTAARKVRTHIDNVESASNTYYFDNSQAITIGDHSQSQYYFGQPPTKS